MQTISPMTEQIIDLAIAEDLCAGDFTTDAIFGDRDVSRGFLVAKSDLVLCGQNIFSFVVERIEARTLGVFQPVTISFFFEDGARIKAGERIAEFSGSTAILLKAERTALNFLQHLSGVATQTRALCDRLPGVRIVNTRKALAGYRELQHYAVRCGGGHSHRDENAPLGAGSRNDHVALEGADDADDAADGGDDVDTPEDVVNHGPRQRKENGTQHAHPDPLSADGGSIGGVHSSTSIR